jgi:uncharacterized protein DUF5906/bifunctional DNA primase/polymerase-like protein
LDIKFWVKRYLDEGWSPIPIPAGEKGPRATGWESADFPPVAFEDGMNVGVHLGRADSYLYDVDLDAKEAALAADILLPVTNRVSGRAGKPRSHRFFTVDRSLPIIHHAPYYGIGGTNDTIVELRGLSKNGSPQQTVIPPSVHPSGEPIEWDQDGKPFHCTTEEQVNAWRNGVRNVAMATLLARSFPGQGNRHNPRLALAAFLFRAGVDPQDILQIGNAVMKIIGGDVSDWQLAARSTIAKLQSDPGAQVVGGPTLREMLQDGELVLKRLNRMLGRTEEAATDEIVDRFNKSYFIIEAGATVVVGDDSNPAFLKLWPFPEFRKKFCKEFMPSERKEITRGPNAGTTKIVKGRPQVDVWLEHPKGARFEQLVYAPPGSLVEPGARDYNGWKGFAIKTEAGKWDLIDQHIREVVCAGDPRLYDWVMNWSAALLQRPGQHAWTALVMRGGQGVGKGTFAHDLLGTCFHQRHYVHIVNRDQFYGRFNDLLSGKVLVFLDEATWGGDKREAGVLKGRVTSDTMEIERKHLPALTEVSMMHLILASNEDWPVGIDRDDRRFVALDLPNDHANQAAYFTPLYQQIKNGGREAFLHALLNEWDVDEEELRKPPATSAKDELKHQSLPPEAEWWLERLRDGRLLLNDKKWNEHDVHRQPLYAEYVQALSNAGIGHRKSIDGLGRFLNKACPSLRSGRPQKGGPRTWLFPPLATARREMDEYLSMKIQWDEEEKELLDEPLNI